MVNKVSILILCFILLYAIPAYSLNVDSSDGGVDILSEVSHDSEGRNYRYGYYGRNNNNFAINISISLTSCNNCNDGLIKGNVKVMPGNTIFLGTINQADLSRKWTFHYTWRWTKIKRTGEEGTGG